MKSRKSVPDGIKVIPREYRKGTEFYYRSDETWRHKHTKIVVKAGPYATRDELKHLEEVAWMNSGDNSKISKVDKENSDDKQRSIRLIKQKIMMRG